jgi:hypothetical protein
MTEAAQNHPHPPNARVPVEPVMRGPLLALGFLIGGLVLLGQMMIVGDGNLIYELLFTSASTVLWYAILAIAVVRHLNPNRWGKDPRVGPLPENGAPLGDREVTRSHIRFLLLVLVLLALMLPLEDDSAVSGGGLWIAVAAAMRLSDRQIARRESQTGARFYVRHRIWPHVLRPWKAPKPWWFVAPPSVYEEHVGAQSQVAHGAP